MSDYMTKYEIESSWLQDQAEALGAKSMTDYYESLLLRGQQSAQRGAATQYNQDVNRATAVANRDISGAYANYMKQQRAILAQSGIESGFKEEVSDALLEDFIASRASAKATLADNIASAANNAAETYSTAYKATSTMVSQLKDYYTKQAETYANLFKAGESFAQTKGSMAGEWYKLNTNTGKTEVTPWGREQFRYALLNYGGEFKDYLETNKLKDELALYSSNPAYLNNELFGFKETEYGLTEQSTNQIGSDKLSIYTDNYIETSYNDLHKTLADEKKTVTDFYTTTMENLGLTGKEFVVKKALLAEAGKKYSSDKIDKMSLEDAIAENWKWRGETGQPTKDIMIKYYYKWLVNYAKETYKVKE